MKLFFNHANQPVKCHIWQCSLSCLTRGQSHREECCTCSFLQPPEKEAWFYSLQIQQAPLNSDTKPMELYMQHQQHYSDVAHHVLKTIENYADDYQIESCSVSLSKESCTLASHSSFVFLSVWCMECNAPSHCCLFSVAKLKYE